ncbi:MAG: beta-glucuronidase, partial [Bacteroidetes bacterium]|nr:beta-glucuronidase [Bacteroidota bacterium]
TLTTKWTGSIYDSSWFFQPRLAKYRQPGNIKIPFWLTPNKEYVGAAWYRREVIIPAAWQQKHITLFLERAHTETTVWVDGQEAGMQNSFVAPHEYDLSRYLSPGRHIICMRIDNRIKSINPGPDSHSLTDHTQGNWNGIIGDMSLQCDAGPRITDMQVYPDLQKKSVAVKISLSAIGDAKGTIQLSAYGFNAKTFYREKPVEPRLKTIAFHYNGGDTTLDIQLPMGDDVQYWDEFSPALYRLRAVVTTAAESQSTRETTFGMRAFTIRERQFLINGRPVFLRGTLDCCEFPLTGYPPTDTAAWGRIFRIARAHGLNHFRFHSWCPPEAAFVAADKAGFYLQIEGPSWPNHGTSIGDGKPIDQFLFDEADRILKTYGNHPSFCMLAAGNEPAGRNQVAYLTKFIAWCHERDTRHVYTGASVAMSWPLVPSNEYMIKSGARGLAWDHLPGTDDDYANAIAKFTMPYVTHEMGQWCVFPDFREIAEYTGTYRARNFELFRQDLADQGMEDRGLAFLMASGKLQALCYKYEIERTLRTAGLGGFQLLSLQDFPGQGTALIGVLNAFWKEKGYISAAQFRRFCNSTVPLARMEKLVYSNNETFEAGIEIYHYGAKPLDHPAVNWTISDERGTVIEHGAFHPDQIPIGNSFRLGKAELLLNKIAKAGKYRLEVTVANTSFANDWDFWVYPARLPALNTQDILYTDTLDAKAEAVLNNGGKVFLHAAGKVVKGKEVVQQFTPVFWNTSWFKMRPPHTLGFVCDGSHPVFRYFPTASYSTLQWWEIVNKAQV